MTVKKGGGRRKSLWHGNETIRLPEHPRKGGGHVHRDGHCYEAGMRFNEADCRGGGRESGDTPMEARQVPGESRSVAAASPAALCVAEILKILEKNLTIDAMASVEGYLWTLQGLAEDRKAWERIRELEADYAKLWKAFEDAHAQMSVAEADAIQEGERHLQTLDKLAKAEARVKEVTHTRLRTTTADRDELRERPPRKGEECGG